MDIDEASGYTAAEEDLAIFDPNIVSIASLANVQMEYAVPFRTYKNVEVDAKLVRFVLIVLPNRAEARPTCNTTFIKSEISSRNKRLSTIYGRPSA